MSDDSPASEKLYRAILADDAEATLCWLDSGKRGLLSDYEGMPLEIAVEAGSLEVVRRLLDAGVDWAETVDAILPRAARTGDVEGLELLILAGAEDREDESGERALDIAATRGDLASVELLLEAFGSARAAAALRPAARAGHETIFRLLENHIEDAEIVAQARRRLRRTLRIRSLAGRMERAHELCEAVDAGDAATVKAELRRGASPDAFLPDWRGEPICALERAARRSDARIADLLLGAGAAVDGPADEHGRLADTTPLLRAIKAGAFDLAERLIDAGADVEAPAPAPLLALMLDGFEAEKGTYSPDAPSLVKALVRAGADLDARDEQGFTAVIWAARRPSPPLLGTLLELGARVDLADENDNTAATHAHFRSLLVGQDQRRKSYKAARRLLGGPTAHQLDVELMAAAFRGDEARCRKLLGRGADPSHLYEGWTAVDYARAGQHEDLARMLEI